METKEQWINKTLESLDEAEQAGLNPFVQETILQRVKTPSFIVHSVSYKRIWKLAAVILILISLNVFTLLYFPPSSSTVKNPVKVIAGEYFSYIDIYNL